MIMRPSSFHINTFQQRISMFQILQGNTNVRNVVRHDLDPTIIARYIRIHPGYYLGKITCMRLELYGCVVKGL